MTVIAHGTSGPTKAPKRKFIILGYVIIGLTFVGTTVATKMVEDGYAEASPYLFSYVEKAYETANYWYHLAKGDVARTEAKRLEDEKAAADKAAADAAAKAKADAAPPADALARKDEAAQWKAERDMYDSVRHPERF
ncbi:hypothetical protein [Rhizobium binxianense]|uniref:hypothetical protein n=1 Tax=Rhizobium binxianense TaxID=3024242 RepID=UPI00235F7E89|nr:hypothetical protein [Rhizobium sp. MJ37]MDC9835547.1 hypothetical protein [Rhizobium sp. MJ37]